VEVALALVLLIGGGLLLRAFQRLDSIDPGFRRDGVLIYRVSIANPKYRDIAPRIQLIDRLLERSRALPGVVSVAMTSIPPLGGHSGTFFRAEGAPPRRDTDPTPVVLRMSTSPGYLKTMGIQLLEGRDFADADNLPDAPPVVVVNQSFARLHWPNGSAIGKRIAQGDNNWLTIIGVSADIKHYGLERDMRPSVSYPSKLPQGGAAIVLRASGNPADLTAPSRALLRELEPDAAMFDIRTMEDRLRESTVTRRTYSTMLWAFAGIALLLSVGGMYGVLNYAIGQRSSELGIRMALGAAPARLTRDVLAEGLAVVGVGLVVGAVGAFFVGRAMSSLLLGIPAWQPATFAGAGLLLLLFAVIANYIPARRVAVIDPASVLRT
jgi:predicted permease